MNVLDILRSKGAKVVTTEADAPIASAARLLVERNVGSAVIVDPGGSVLGVITERDILRGLVAHGEALLAMRVGDLMARDVVFCAPEDRLSDLMVVMTARRIRHLPVLLDGGLAGIVSIGDVVKARLEETESEATALREYITAAR